MDAAMNAPHRAASATTPAAPAPATRAARCLATPPPPLPRTPLLPCRVKSYEGKLATLTAINSALQSENEDLRRQLKAAAAPTTATGATPRARRRAAAGPAAGAAWAVPRGWDAAAGCPTLF